MGRRERTDPDMRSRVLRFVAECPGTFASEAGRGIGVPQATTEYHLARLERQGILTSRVYLGRKRYFYASGISFQHQLMSCLLRQPAELRVLAHLMARPASTLTDLCSGLELPKSTLWYQLRRLVDARAVREEAVGRTKRYWVVRGEQIPALETEMRCSSTGRGVHRHKSRQRR